MNDLDAFMENAQDKYFTLHIENTSIQYLPVVCEGYVKVTEENEKEMMDYIISAGTDSTYWKTKRGILMVFSDEIGRTIPMFVANASMPFHLTKTETGLYFNTMSYIPELNMKKPDEVVA